MKRDWFTANTRAQAYTLEAVIAVLLIFAVVMFVAPSFATPATDADSDALQKEAQVEQEVQTMLEKHASDGQLKSSLLNYNDGEEQWRNGFTSPEGGHYVRPPNDAFGDSITDIQERHDVVIDIYLVPESHAPDDEQPDRVRFLQQAEETSYITTTSTTITFYNDDRLRSVPEVHTRQGTSLPQYLGEGDRIEDADNYPVESATDPGANEEVYNVVTVQVVINDNE